MGSPTMVTMLAPNGQSGDVPVSNVQTAQQAGFKVAVTMKSPDGQTGYIPAERVHDAASAGFKMVPIDAPDAAKASYWDALTNPVGAGGREQGLLGGALQVGGQAIKSMVQPVAHPIDTLESLYNTVRHPVNTAEGIANQVKSDYAQGGVPLAAENLGGQVLGGVEGGRIMAAAAQPAVEAAGRGAAQVAPKLYQSALKPSTTLSQAERSAVTQTGLANSIPVSADGMDKISTQINALNQAIKDQIAADPTRQISTTPAMQNLAATRAKFQTQVAPGTDLQQIDAVGKEFAGQAPGGTLPAAQAQAMKQGTYQALGSKSYGEVKGASIEAQKALARGLKDEIATQFPQIGQLNAQDSKLLDLQPVLERAVNRISNHQLIGIGTPIVGTAARAVTGSGATGLVSMLIKGVVDDPMVKSRLAIALSKGANIPYAQAAARVGAYSTALGSSVSSAQGNMSAASPSQ